MVAPLCGPGSSSKNCVPALLIRSFFSAYQLKGNFLHKTSLKLYCKFYSTLFCDLVFRFFYHDRLLVQFFNQLKRPKPNILKTTYFNTYMTDNRLECFHLVQRCKIFSQSKLLKRFLSKAQRLCNSNHSNCRNCKNLSCFFHVLCTLLSLPFFSQNLLYMQDIGQRVSIRRWWTPHIFQTDLFLVKFFLSTGRNDVRCDSFTHKGR